eukprot:UN31146
MDELMTTEKGQKGGRENQKKQMKIEKVSIPKQPQVIEQDIKECTIEFIGYVSSILNNNIISFGPKDVIKNTELVHYDTAICLKDKTKIGRIDNILGLVKQPIYTCVIDPKLSERLQPGTEIYYIPSISKKLVETDLDRSKPTDLDENDDEVYFSDDEAERRYMEQNKRKRKIEGDGGSRKKFKKSGVENYMGNKKTSRNQQGRTRTNFKPNNNRNMRNFNKPHPINVTNNHIQKRGINNNQNYSKQQNNNNFRNNQQNNNYRSYQKGYVSQQAYKPYQSNNPRNQNNPRRNENVQRNDNNQ